MSGRSTLQQQQRQQSSESGSLDGGPAEPTTLACNACRKRKLRCSREVPACQHCRKTVSECVYETKRAKPGLKPGAVENVHRRLDALERIVHRLDQDAEQHRTAQPGRDEVDSRSQEKGAYDILALLARELPKCLKGNTDTEASASTPPTAELGSSKRRRIDEQPPAETNNGDADDGVSPPGLPPPRVLGAVLDAYFACIHPWIPMVHQSRLRRRLADPQERPKLDILLHAMVLVASRFVSGEDVTVSCPARLRAWVVSTAIDCMSVESLQAMIMLAFDDIGSGQASKAWSFIGSMTRTVEYLQLSVEREETKRRPLLQPFVSLPPTEDWTENEERRRVFWNVFALDRFCSVAMGWNTSLTSDDVHRRLPCDGILWRKQDSVVTPYFGIWDKASARIGNPIAFLPSQASTVTIAPSDAGSRPSLPEQPLNPTAESSAQGAGGADMTTVGAYAYCIEATESLSRVTSHFLQQPINWRDPRDISLWLTRFKELDLRLVHWKMLLPQKWKADSYLRSSTTNNRGPGSGSPPLIMDPNLTLAHVTHNASMILLHQPIAFPPPGLGSFQARLPSACSVETCLAAATEITNITTKYLETTAATMPVAHQYAFCVYIAARVLLVNWRYGYIDADAQLPGEFWALLGVLEEFSLRWRGGGGGGMTTEQPAIAWDLAAKYSRRLRELHACCLQDPGFKVNLAAYTVEIDHSSTAATIRDTSLGVPGDSYQVQAAPSQSNLAMNWGMYGPSSHIPTQMPTREQNYGANALSPSNSTASGSGLLTRGGVEILNPEPNSLGSISQTLLDQQFGEMDRIISFEDGTMFAATMDCAGEPAEAWLSAGMGLEGGMGYAGTG